MTITLRGMHFIQSEWESQPAIYPKYSQRAKIPPFTLKFPRIFGLMSILGVGRNQ